MQFRDREIVVGKGEFLVVPHGTEHRPVADDEVHVLLFEPASTVNTVPRAVRARVMPSGCRTENQALPGRRAAPPHNSPSVLRFTY